jgi:arginyl-tRNA synthetase
MTNIFLEILKHIIDTAQRTFSIKKITENITVEIPNNRNNGDLSTNIAFVISEKLGLTPKEVASSLSNHLTKIDLVDNISVAGPGFINLKMKPEFWNEFLKRAIIDNDKYGIVNIGLGEKINLEFVSANPTGPLHLGHTRSAVFGDVIARILKAMGYEVTKEYYINDAGSQIAVLAKSVKIRYDNLFGANKEIPEGCYPGEYLIKVAEKIKNHFKSDLDNEDERKIIDFIVNEMMENIKKDLADLGVNHDVFVSEYHDIIKRDQVKNCIKILETKNLIYNGVLEAPKGQQDDDWEPEEQMIFKSKDFGDDSDRPIIKSDGTLTYFAGDIAYHQYKLARGFNNMILMLGADHIGYTKRIKAIVAALSDNKAKIEVKINQLINLYKDGKPLKMSKRSGSYVTLRDALDEIGKDTLRFTILSKKSDTPLDIDFAKLKEQNKENPVWYVQYAYTRGMSLLRKAQELGFDTDQHLEEHNYFFPEDIELIKILASYPKILQSAASLLEPHRLNYYLQDLANSFHHLWALGNTDLKYRFIDEENKSATIARLQIVKLLTNTMRNVLGLLGITPLERM